jgi:hypothetical protein
MFHHNAGTRMNKGIRGETSTFKMVSSVGSPGDHFPIRMGSIWQMYHIDNYLD